MIDLKKCCITRYPEPVLAKKAEPIEEITDDIRRLAEKMIDIMIETKGVGLAGPQAGVSLRIFVASPDASREGAKVYINPTINPAGAVEAIEEGCLSLPNIYGKIRRHTKCTVTAIGLDGKKFVEEAQGLLARIFQHEFDHLEGTLVADRMGTVAKIAARKHLKELQQKYEQSQRRN
jgi:peptide deformylase